MANRWRLLIFASAVALYAVTLGHGFVFDDGVAIVGNVHIRSFDNLSQIFTSTEWAGGGLENHQYRPLAVATYALNYLLAGLAPWSYHLVNVLLHGLVSVLVFGLALRWRLSITAAAIGALLFAVHPVHVEVVAGIVGRKDLLAAAFTLTMVLSHATAVRRGGVSQATPVLAYAAAMFSKEVGVVGIGLVLLHDLLLRDDASRTRETRRRVVVLYGAYIGVGAAYLVARWLAVGSFGVATIPFYDNPAAHASTGMRLATAVAVIGKGLALLLLPLKLSPDYSYEAIPVVRAFADVRFAAALLALVAIIAFVVVKRRAAPLLLLAAYWYALTLLPGSNFLLPIGTIFGERLLYLPSAAFCLVAAWTLAATFKKRFPRALAVASVLILALLGARTVHYATAWSADLALFSAAARAVPNSTKVHQKLGEALLADGRPGAAATAEQRALTIAPDNQKATVHLADAYRELGRWDEAGELLQSVLEANGEDAHALYGMGRLLRDEGRLVEAGDHWRRALAIDPNHAGSLSDLGALQFMLGDTAAAREYSERAVRADPMMASAWYNLGLLYRRAGDGERAREAFEEFVRVAPPQFADQVSRVRAMLDETSPGED